MLEAFKVVGSFFINNEDANKNIDETTGKAESASGKLGKAFGAIATGVTVAVTACATAIAGMTKQAVEAYANYEQLVGGIETLYGTAGKSLEQYVQEVAKQVEEQGFTPDLEGIAERWKALEAVEQKVLQNASNAYKTAGLSANEYMETITGFTASLKQVIDDTSVVADYADMAVTDMADNANKMGTSMESIQVAYAGFAKQNYTMLDNLKLGYGGTKEEMQRLLKDAEAISGIKYDLSSFADVVDAIHVIQTDLGITGTTALEAEKTISGSLASLKSVWQNTLVAMADEEADFSLVISQLVDSSIIALNNLLPRIQIVFQAIPELVNQLAPQIPAIVETIFPSLLQGAVSLLNSLVAQLPALIGILGSAIISQAPLLFATISDLLSGMADFIQTNLPILTDKAKEMMKGLSGKIEENLPEVISKGLDILMGLSETILENVPVLIGVGMEFIKSLVVGIVNSLPELIAKVPEIITNFANTISASMQTILAKGVEIIWAIIKGIIQAIPDLVKNIPKIIEAIFAVWNAVNWLNLGKNLITGITNGIKNLSGNMISNVQTIFTNLKNAILQPIETAKTSIKAIIDAIKGFFSGMKLSFPNIPLPHFSVTPSGWKIADLLKGTIPKLGISWYAKAMDNPMLFTRPTLFDVNPMTGQARGAGEAGDEVMIGKDTMLNMIQEAVAQENALMMTSVDNVLNKIFDLLSEYVPEMAHTQMVLDTGVMVGELAPAMDTALGVVYKKRKRGV